MQAEEARTLAYGDLTSGLMWIDEEMSALQAAVKNGALMTESNEALLEMRKQWVDIREKVGNAHANIERGITELMALIRIKHERVERELRGGHVPIKQELAQPVVIPAVEPVLPPGKKRSVYSLSEPSSLGGRG